MIFFIFRKYRGKNFKFKVVRTSQFMLLMNTHVAHNMTLRHACIRLQKKKKKTLITLCQAF